MKRLYNIVITALFMFFIFSLILIYGDNKVVSAEDQNSIFNLDADGYWKPSDIKSHDFIIRNGFGEICYLDSLSFKKSEISDVESKKEYTLNEANKAGIIDEYNVVLSMEDDKYGNNVLYDGKLKDLDNNDIKLSKGLYMNIGQEIKFNIKISMDDKAGNEYQNKHYVFTIIPKWHKVVYTGEDKYEEEDGDFEKKRNSTIDGYYDNDGNWHNGYYYDENGVKHEQDFLSDGVNRINKYFKTGQGMVAIMGYEIMFITCCFFVMYRIRQRQNAL